ncbi:2520_t:CDS:2 [Ambispora leptoticha]|uniref:2520_t:CDS:1 n=1 Tax=Ambispora leptoticha TaxID=144679 RepID=A0A9N8WSK5_9GLOM|nr:2520_t:CDS:2 [Ambispora leptoticha]
MNYVVLQNSRGRSAALVNFGSRVISSTIKKVAKKILDSLKMVAELPNECLQFIFKKIPPAEINSLHSIILVNRKWCQNAMPILWENPFSEEINLPLSHKVFSTYLLFIPDSVRADLETKINRVLPDSSFVKNKTFDYPSFLKQFHLDEIFWSIRRWLDSLKYISESKREKRRDYLVVVFLEICKLFSKHKVKVNTFISRIASDYFFHSTLESAGEEFVQDVCLKINDLKRSYIDYGCFSHLRCLEFILMKYHSDLLIYLSDHCRNISTIKITITWRSPKLESFADPLIKFIRAQKGIHELSIITRSDHGNTTYEISPIFKAIVTQANSLRKLEFAKIGRFDKLLESFSKLQDFPKLEYIIFEEIFLTDTRPSSKVEWRKSIHSMVKICGGRIEKFVTNTASIGSEGVGKTSLVVRYTQKTFSPNASSTIGASFNAKKLVVDNCKVRLQIWDTAGQERFRSMAPMYYRGANAAILVYDITSEQSFLDMNSWIEELRKNMTEDLIIHVVGNKIDLAPTQRVIPLKRTQEYVARVLGDNCGVHEVSAKDDKGIEELFLQITRNLVERKNELERGPRPIINPYNPNPKYRPNRMIDEPNQRSCCNS